MNLVDLSRKPLVVGEDGVVGGADLGCAGSLGQQAEGLAGEVHLVADVGLHVGGHAAERAVADGLVADVVDLLLRGRA